MKRLNNFLLLCLFGILCTVASAMAVDMGPSIQAKNIVFYGSDDDGYIVRCTRGNGNGRVLVAQKLEASETASDAVWLDDAELQDAVSTFSGADEPAEYVNVNLEVLDGTPVGTPVIVADLTGTNREVTVTGLTDGANIAYSVYEYNQSGSTYVFNTNTASLNPRVKKFIAVTPTIDWPSDETAITQTATTINLKWTVNGTFSYYTLDVIKNDFSEEVYSNLDIGTVTSFLVDGLTAATTYMCRVTGYTASGAVATVWKLITTDAAVNAPVLSTPTISINGKTGGTLNAVDVTKPLSLELTFDQAMDPALGSVVLNSATDDADNTKNTFTETARSWDNENKTLTLIYTIGTTADEADIKATLNDFANVDGIAITANTATDPLFSIDVTAPTATLELTVANGTGATPTTGYAIKGNVITATIAAGEAIAKPENLSLKIGENETAIACSEFNATETTGDDAYKVWTAIYTVVAGETPSPDGVIAMPTAAVTVTDLAGNVSGAIADYYYNSSVDNNITIDTQTPTATLELTVANGTGTAPAAGYAITGNVITATIVAGEAIAKPEVFSLKIGENETEIACSEFNATVTTGDDAYKVWTATYTVDAASTPDGVIAMPTAAVTVTDLAGNVSDAIADYVYDADNNDLTIDASAPTLTVEFSATNEFDAGKADSTNCTTTGSVSAPTYYNNSTEDNLVITVAANEPVTKPDCENISGSVDWQAYTVENEVWTPSDQQPTEGGTAQYWRGTYTYTVEPGTIATPSVTANAVSGLASAATAATGTVTVATNPPTLTVKKIYSDLTNDKSRAGLTNKITIVLSSNEAIYYPTKLVLKDDAEPPLELDLCFAPATYSNPVGTKITANVPEICMYWIAEVPVSSLTDYTFTDGKLSADNIAVKSSETFGGAYNEKGILATPTFEDNNSIGDVTIFLTAPVIANLTLTSSNTNDNKLAKEGDVITLTLTTYEQYPADEVTITPTVTVATTPTATPITFTPTYATSGSFSTWTLTHTVAAGDPEGALSADVAFTYLYNAATKTTANNGDDPDEVTIDRTAPTATLVAEVNKDATPRTDGWAQAGDVITFTLTADEALKAAPTAAFKVGTTQIETTNWETTDADQEVWTATYTVPTYDAQNPANSPQGLVALAASFKVKDLAGNESADVTAVTFDGDDDISTVTVDTKAPSVETLAVSVAKANTNPAEARTDGYAQAGDIITFTLTAKEALKEAPTAAFTVGGSDITLDVESNITWTTPTEGNGKDIVWTATYTVPTYDAQTPANSPQGKVALKDATCSLTDLAGNITAAAAIIDDDVTVDTKGPSVNSLEVSVAKSDNTARTDGYAQATDVITFTLTADEALKAAPTGTFKVGNTDITLNNIQGVIWTPSGADKIWTATYTVEADKNGELALAGDYTITDLAGNESAACSTFAVAEDIEGDKIVVDTDVPGVTTLVASVTSAGNARTDGWAQTGDVITFTLTASEVLKAAPTATFNVGETAITLAGASPYWTSSDAGITWTATYTVPTYELGTIPQGLVALAASFKVKDLADNESDACSTFTTTSNAGITVDTKGPSVNSLEVSVAKSDNTARTDGWAQAGDVITFTLTADEALKAAPTVAFKVGGSDITLDVESNTTWTTPTEGNDKDIVWTATYTVVANSPQGLVALNGTTCTLTDLAGNESAACSTNVGITVDTKAPTLASARITSNNANTSLAKENNTVTFTFTADEAIKGLTTDNIKLFAAAELANVTVESADNITWTATYTVPLEDASEGNIYAVVSGITDLAGNAIVGEELTEGETTVYTTPAGGIVANNIITFNADDPRGLDPVPAGTCKDNDGASYVTIDITAPSVETLAVSVAKANTNPAEARTDGYAQAGDIITFTLTASKAIAAPTVAFKVGGSDITLDVENNITWTTPTEGNGKDIVWTATYTVVANSPQGLVALKDATYIVTDLAGNESAACSTFTTTSNAGITVDTKAPVVTITKVKGAAYDDANAATIYVDDVCTFEYNVVEVNAGATTVALDKNTPQPPTSNPVNFNALTGWSSLNGAFDLTVASTDAAGNKGTITINNLTKRADLAQPTLSCKDGNNNAVTTGSTICVGTAYTLSVSNTEGNYPTGTTYEWYKGDDEINDQTGASLSVSAGNETEPTTYTYKVKAVNADYCTTTSAASEVFTVVVKPVLAQPTITATQGAENLTALDNNSTLCVGTAYTLSVSNTEGNYPDGTTYEWYKGGTKIDAQTGASLSVSAGNETEPTTYTYTVKVLHSNYCSASVASADFVVTVKPSMAQPTIAEAAANSGITTVAGVNYACAAGFTLTASTTDKLNTTQAYLWYSKDGADAEYVKINGATTASLAQTDMTAGTHYYKVVAQNGDKYCSNSAESKEYVVIINPTNFTVGITGTYKEAEASGNEPIVDNTITSGLPYSITLTGAIDPKLAPEVISYQWQKKTTGGTYSNLLAATATTKALTVNITQFGIYDYRLIVTTIDGCQTTRTQDFTLNVLQPLGTATLAATSAAICPEDTTSVTATLNLSEMPEVAPTCQLQEENTTTTTATWDNVGVAENVTVANMTPTHTFGNLGLGKYRAVFACGGYASVTTGVFEVTAKSTLDTPTITATCGDKTFEGPVCPGTQVKLTPSVPEVTTGTTTYTWIQSSDNTNFAPVTEGVDANGVLTVTASNAPTYYRLSAVNADYCIGIGAAYTLNVNTAAHPDYTIVSNDQVNEVAPGNQVTLTATPQSTAVDNTDYTWYYAIAADAPVDASGWTEITAQTAGYTIANNTLTATISTVPSTWFKVVAHAPTVCTDGSATLEITTTLVLPALTLDNDAKAETAASANVCGVETVELTAAFAVATEGVSYQLEKETATAGEFANEGEAKTTAPFTWAVGVGNYRVVASKTNYPVQTSNEFIITPKPAIQPAVTVNPFTPGTICVGGALTLEATYSESVTAPTNAHYQWQSAASNSDASYADITDATEATYAVPTTSPAAMTYYRVVVTSDDLCGEDKSAGVAVVVNPYLPANTLEIAGQEKTAEGAYTAINEAKDVLVGNTVQLTATATDAPANTEYAWYEGTSAAGNALTTAGEYTVNGATLTIASNTAGKKNFTVKVSNPGYCGDETATYTYTVKPQMPTPTVLLYLSGTPLPPANAITICEGSDVEISAGISEQVSNNVTCAWSKDPANGFTDADADADALTYTDVTAANAGSYTVTVTHPDYYGSATSDAFSLVVKPTLTVPVITSTDLAAGNIVCESTTFTLNVSNAPTSNAPTYKWYKGQTNVYTGASYEVAGGITENTTYTVIAMAGETYCADVTSTDFLVTVKPSLPANTTVAIKNVAAQCPTTEGTVTLTATVTNAPNDATASYQWYTVTGGSDAIINGATSATYAASIAAAGTTIYKVVVSYSDHCGTIEATKDVVVNSQLATPAITAKVGEGDNATTFCLGDEITFTATAIEGATYTWEYLNGTDWVAANNAQGVNNVNLIAWTPTAAASYTLRVTASKDNVCPATSEEFIYIVNPTVTVTEDNFALTATTATGALASGAQVATGTEVNFAVNTTLPAGVVAPTAYAWYIGDSQTPVADQTGSTFAYTAETAGEVSVTVKFIPTVSTNYCGSITEQTRTFTYSVVAAPIAVSISANGVANNGSVCSNANVVLTATAENVPEDATPIYTWQKLSDAEYVDVTTDDGTCFGNKLLLNLTAGTHTYRAVVTVNNTNYTTDNFTLTVHQAYTANNVSVAISAISPSNVNLAAVPAGTEVTFTATPNPAALTYTYQWYVNGAAVTDATNETYTYTAPAAGTIGYVYCVATLNGTGICIDPLWNGEKSSNIATVTAVADPNALGEITSLYATGITKYTATLNWTKSNPNDNVVIYLKNMATDGEPAFPENGVPQASSVFSSGIQAVYVGSGNSVTLSGLAKRTNYTAYVFVYNSTNYIQHSATYVADTTFKTKAFKEAYEITDPYFDGEFSLSPINPNPITGDELNFNIDSWVNANYEIELFNSNGDYITGMTQMLSEGIHSMKLDLNSQKGGLNSGAYVLRVTSNGQTLSQPVRIVR